MKIIRTVIFRFVFASAISLSLATAAELTAVELQPIFNGTNLAGWQVPEPNPFWRAENGVLVGENNDSLKGHVLHTDRAYTNFVLELEARWSGEIDSGVMFREPELQVQFGISRSLKKDMTGAFYLAKHPLNPKVGYPEAGQTRGIEQIFKTNAWNKFRIEARNNTFSVWLNETPVSQYTDARYAGGAPLGLQVHPGLKMKAEFRHLRAAPLD